MAAIERVDRAQFKIDFVALKRSLLPLGRRMLFSPRMLQLDPQLMIKRLKQENKELREEIAMLKGEAMDRGDTELADEEKARLMELVGLNHSFNNRFPHELSGGQARRVGVARALTLSPKLIIADEPTAGLDVSVQGEILNLMRDLQKQLGISYLIVTHNLPVVRHISDRIAVMYLGRLLEQGDTRSIFRSPAHPYTRVLLDAVPQPDPAKRRAFASIEGEVPSLRDRPAGCEFHPRCAFRQERCLSEPPESRPLADGRTVRCHFPLEAG